MPNPNDIIQAIDAVTGDLKWEFDAFDPTVHRQERHRGARQGLMELYEKFFATALTKEADRLGIVYTPVEVVDYILSSADRVLNRDFRLGERAMRFVNDDRAVLIVKRPASPRGHSAAC